MLVGIRYSTFSLIYFALGIQSTAVISVDLISLQMLEMRSLYVVLDHAYHRKRAVNDTSTVYCDVGVVLDIVIAASSSLLASFSLEYLKNACCVIPHRVITWYIKDIIRNLSYIIERYCGTYIEVF